MFEGGQPADTGIIRTKDQKTVFKVCLSVCPFDLFVLYATLRIFR